MPVLQTPYTTVSKKVSRYQKDIKSHDGPNREGVRVKIRWLLYARKWVESYLRLQIKFYKVQRRCIWTYETWIIFILQNS